MSVSPHRNEPTEFWNSKVKPWLPSTLRRSFNMAEESDIKLSEEAERLLLASSSSASSVLTVDDWTDGFRAAFGLASNAKLMPTAVEPLRRIACLMAQTVLSSLKNTPNSTLVSNQWTAANALFGSPSDNGTTPTMTSCNLTTTKGKPPFPCNEVPLTNDTDDARKILVKNGYLRIDASFELSDQQSQLWKTAKEWLSKSSSKVSPLVYDQHFMDLQSYVTMIRNQYGHEMSWRQFFGHVFDQHIWVESDAVHGLREWALSLALTPPTCFTFTDGGNDQQVYGFLAPTESAEQWYGAMEAFGKGWYNPIARNVVQGVQWTAVSLRSGTIMQAWREAEERNGLHGLAAQEIEHPTAINECVASIISRLGYQPQHNLEVGCWHFIFQTAFDPNQRFLTDSEAECVKTYACRLALTHPSKFVNSYVEDHANADQGFLAINFTTGSWLAAAAILGSPWNSSGDSGDCRDQPSVHNHVPTPTSVSAEDDVFSTLDEATKNDLIIAINSTYARSSTYYSKVLVAGSVAAALFKMSLVEYALPQTTKEGNVEVLDSTSNKFPIIGELEGKMLDTVTNGYKQLKDASEAAKAKTAGLLDLDVKTLSKLPEHKQFMRSLRTFRQTASDLRHMNATLTKEAVMAAFRKHFQGCSTSKAYHGKMRRLKKNYDKAHRKRMMAKDKNEEAPANKRPKAEHEQPDLLANSLSETTISSDKPPMLDATGKYSLPGDNWKKLQARMVCLLMRLVVVLEHEDNVISPRKAWQSIRLEVSDQVNDPISMRFISLIFNILLVLKENRGDDEAIRIVRGLGKMGLLLVDAMAAASEEDVTSVVKQHAENIDVTWIVPLAAEIMAVHQGITPVTSHDLRRLDAVKNILSEAAMKLFFQDLGYSRDLVVDTDSRKILLAMEMIDANEYNDPSSQEVDMDKLAKGNVEESLMTWIPPWEYQTFQDTVRTLVELIKFPTTPAEQMARTLGKRIKEKFVKEEQGVLIAMIYKIAAALQNEKECNRWLHWLCNDDAVKALSIRAVAGRKASLNDSQRPNPTCILPKDPFWLPPLETSDIALVEYFFALARSDDCNFIKVNAIRTLCPGQWLDDEVMNSWRTMLNVQERKRHPDDVYLRSICLSCYFWQKLVASGDPNPEDASLGYNFSETTEWSKRFYKETVLSYCNVLFFINRNGNHWVLVVAQLWNKTIKYLDSLGDSGKVHLEIIKRFLGDEHKRMGRSFESDEWTLVECDPKLVPQQINGVDCGVYACLYAQFIVRDWPLQFTPEQVISMRYHIAHAIIRGSAPKWPRMN